MTAQASLNFTPPPSADVRDHEANWRAFLAAHPDFFALLLSYCRNERSSGQKRISMARAWEAMRGTLGRGVRLDNSWRAIAARDVMAADPQLGSMIEMRRRRVP